MAILLLMIPGLIEHEKTGIIAQEPAATGGGQPRRIQDASNQVRTYEVVSIKPHKAETGSTGGTRTLPDGFQYTNIPLSLFVFGSYGLKIDSQVEGMPGWAKQENYDIEAKVDAETAERWKNLSRKERLLEEQPMKQSILADRCHFRAHTETKRLPVFDLVIASGGLKMKEASPNEKPMEMMQDGQMTVHAMSTDAIVSAFTGVEGRMIVDKTGLGDKKFDFQLNWTPDDQPAADYSAPTLLTALKEQLGLRLVPASGPVKVLIIEHFERPSPN
jgi:uncharacterized protein (TIGR03435 family)